MKQRVNINIEETLHKAGQTEAKRISKDVGKYVSFSSWLEFLVKMQLDNLRPFK